MLKRRNPVQYDLRTNGLYKPKTEKVKKGRIPTKRDERKLREEG